MSGLFDGNAVADPGRTDTDSGQAGGGHSAPYQVKAEAPGREVLERRLAAADKPAEHLWIAMAMFQVDPRRWAAEQVHLDTENLLTIEGPGCFKCEQKFSNRLARQPCRGAVSD